MPVKVHWIDARGETAPPDGVLGAALRTVREVLPDAMASEGGSDGAAFVVLHRGEAGVWLLMDWWAHGDILCQRLACDTRDGFAAVEDRPLLACIWELEVIAAERDAFVAHMMRETPDRAAWLRA